MWIDSLHKCGAERTFKLTDRTTRTEMSKCELVFNEILSGFFCLRKQFSLEFETERKKNKKKTKLATDWMGESSSSPGPKRFETPVDGATELGVLEFCVWISGFRAGRCVLLLNAWDPPKRFAVRLVCCCFLCISIGCICWIHVCVLGLFSWYFLMSWKFHMCKFQGRCVNHIEEKTT